MKPDIFSLAPSIIKEFLGYLSTVKGKSPLTVEEYFMDLRTFFRYMNIHRGHVPANTPFDEILIDNIDLNFIKTITLTDVYEYMNFVGTERKNKASTRSRKVSSLRTYFHYLTNKVNKLEHNPILELETPKTKKTLPKHLTLEQSIALLNAVDEPYQSRDYCILTLFLNCGMRLSELVNINLNDINYQEHIMRITGKGDKERLVYLNNSCMNAIEQYIKERPVNGVLDKKALFISRQKKRISPKTVQAMVNKYLAKIGLGGPGYSVHTLRHTAATLMYQYGNVDIRVLKDILGHENLGTTEIYTHISNKQMKKASDSNPLSNMKLKNKKQTDE